MAAPRVAFAGQTIPAYAKTVGRAVHVKIYPRPRNLAESREVLRVLQQYGDVVSYRLLKHDYFRAANSALAIYQNANSAQTIINASPLRFESGRVESSSSVSQFVPPTPPSATQVKEENSDPAPQDTPDYAQEEFDEVNTARQRPNEAPGGGTTFTGLGGTDRWGHMRSSLSTEQTATSPPHKESPKPFTRNPNSRKASAADLPDPPPSNKQTLASSYSPPREFHLTIEPSILKHHAYIQRQHYYAGFELDVRTLMGDDLRKRVPVAGLADCQLGKPEVPLRVRLKRHEQRENDKHKEEAMSLRKLWEEGERVREEEREAEREAETKLERRKEEEWEKSMELFKKTKEVRVRNWIY